MLHRGLEFIKIHILVSYCLLSVRTSQSVILKQCIFTYYLLLFKIQLFVAL